MSEKGTNPQRSYFGIGPVFGVADPEASVPPPEPPEPDRVFYPTTVMPEDGHETLLGARLDPVMDIPVKLSEISKPFKLLLLHKFPGGWAWAPDIGTPEFRKSIGDWIYANDLVGRWIWFPGIVKEK